MSKTTNIHAAHQSLAVNLSMNVRREEYLDYMTFQSNERPLFTETFGPMVGLKEEWADQGASPEELDLSAFRYRRPQLAGVPVNLAWMGGPPLVILSDDEECIIARDSMGRNIKLFKNVATLPLPLDYPVRNMDDWLKVKNHYAFSEARFGEGWERAAREHQEAGRVLTVRIPGGFDEPRQLMGEEGVCVAYYEQPELIHEMLDTFVETALRVLDRVTRAVVIDELSVHEDMAGKSGPLAGPKQIAEFIGPYYRRIWDFVRERGTRLFFQDTDGDISPVLESFVEAGLNVSGPMEPTGQNDMVKMREKFGNRLAFTGGIDKHVLRRSPEEIEAELEYRVPPMIRTGGCVLGLDHRIPNGTPLVNYRFYINKIWEIIERES